MLPGRYFQEILLTFNVHSFSCNTKLYRSNLHGYSVYGQHIIGLYSGLVLAMYSQASCMRETSKECRSFDQFYPWVHVHSFTTVYMCTYTARNFTCTYMLHACTCTIPGTVWFACMTYCDNPIVTAHTRQLSTEYHPHL